MHAVDTRSPVNEQPALRQQQTLADSGSFPCTLPRQKAGNALTVVAPRTTSQPVVARFSYGCRLPQQLRLCSSSTDQQAVSWIDTTLRTSARSLSVRGNTAQRFIQQVTH